MSSRDAVLLGNSTLDHDHDQLFEGLAALESCADADLCARLRHFTTVARGHFDREDRLMQGDDFPTRDCHVQEHAAVLASLTEVQGLLAQGDSGIARRLVVELRRWLPEHIAALDQALAQRLFRLETGGSRLVLHPPSPSAATTV